MPKHKKKLPKVKLPWLLVGLVILLIISLFVLLKSLQKPLEFPYYPKSSFKIPEDVLRERIATHSASAVRIPIVMYHYIEYVDRTKDPSRANLATSPFYLEKQIESLKQDGYIFLFSKEIPGYVTNPKSTPSNPVVLTFDDGYEDFYWNALPLLKKYNVKATLYVIYNFIGRRGIPPYLSVDELKQIRDSGLVEIAAHTLTHPYLKGLKFETAKKEIFESKTKLETLLGISVSSFAYPYGAFSEETLQLAKAAGFTNAVSVIPGVNQSTDNLYYLFRLRPGYLNGINPGKTLAAYK